MGVSRKTKKLPEKENPKPQTEEQLMKEVEPHNPEFVAWLRSRNKRKKGE